MRYRFNGLLSQSKSRGAVFVDSNKVGNREYSLILYLLGCTLSWNQCESKGDICTLEFKTKKYIKVGEWAGIGMHIEINIYQSGLFVTSRFDPSMVCDTTKEKLIHLNYTNFDNYDIPKNTQMFRYLKIIDKLIALAKHV